MRRDHASAGQGSGDPLSDDRAPAKKIRLFLVEDHPVVRRGLRMFLRMQSDMVVCGEAAGVAQAKDGISFLNPDLVVVDLGLREGDGFELMDWLRQCHARIRIVVFTLRDDAFSVARAFRCGAQAYVLKGGGTHDLVVAVRLAMQNQCYLSREIYSKVRLHDIGRSSR